MLETPRVRTRIRRLIAEYVAAPVRVLADVDLEYFETADRPVVSDPWIRVVQLASSSTEERWRVYWAPDDRGRVDEALQADHLEWLAAIDAARSGST